VPNNLLRWRHLTITEALTSVMPSNWGFTLTDSRGLRELEYLTYSLILFINSLRPSVMELGFITEGRPGSARHFRTSGFPPTGPAVGVSGRVRHSRPAGSLVPCTGGTGTAVLWFPARAMRARSFSGSQHGLCGHGRSLVPSTSGTWPGGGALRCCMRKKRKRKTEERREEKRDLD